MSSDLHRVVITGMGALTDLGHTVPELWDGMINGRSGVGPITAFEQDDRWDARIAGEVSDWDPSEKLDVSERKRMDRNSQIGYGQVSKPRRRPESISIPVIRIDVVWP
jgi:3-oxoacyl-[acyl-carrier-protein] synthase II